MDKKKIEELQKEFEFRLAEMNGEKGLIPQRNGSKLKNQKLFSELKEAKFEIIEWLEKKQEKEKIQKQKDQEEQKLQDQETIKEKELAGELIYYLVQKEYETFLGTGWYDAEEAKRCNYREEYCADIVFGNKETDFIEVKKINHRDIKESIKTFGIGMNDNYWIVSKTEYSKLIEIEKTKNEEEIKEREERKAKKKAENHAIFQKAKETGEPQKISSFTVDCQDRNEECNTDIVTKMAQPDGTIKTIVSHTW